MLPMTLDPTQLPDDIATLKAMVIAAERKASDRGLEIEALKLTIAKLQRNTFGASSESGKKLLDQLELQLAELEEGMAEDKATAAIATHCASATADKGEDGHHRKPARRPLPSHLPRERVVHAAPSCCPGCGGSLRKLGEDVTETLEHVPAQWKVIRHVREKFVCRKCEAIAQSPAPSHPIARGRAGPNLLAQVLFAKYRAHLPLNRQSDIYAKEGIDLDVSTLADWVGACAATLMPLVDATAEHVFAAERIHADDTTVARQGQVPDRAAVDLCARRQALRWSDGSGSALLLRARSRRRAPRETSRRLPAASCRPTPMPASTSSMLRGASRASSLRRRVGPMAGASSSSWPSCRRHRSQSRPCAASMNSSPSSVRST